MSGIQAQITNVLSEHQTNINAKADNPETWSAGCMCGWVASYLNVDRPDAEMNHARHVSACIVDAMERWLPPLFASAIHGYADSELCGYSYHGDGSAIYALEKLNKEATQVAAYALTSTKWKAS